MQGAITTRRRRGIAASRERTTTGRRPISGGSHHQSSPRSGRVFMWPPRRTGMSGDRPTRRVHRWGGPRTRCNRRRLPQHGSERGVLQVRRRKGLRRCAAGLPSWPRSGGFRQRLCSLAIGPWHKCGIDTPQRQANGGSCSTRAVMRWFARRAGELGRLNSFDLGYSIDGFVEGGSRASATPSPISSRFHRERFRSASETGSPFGPSRAGRRASVRSISARSPESSSSSRRSRRHARVSLLASSVNSTRRRSGPALVAYPTIFRMVGERIERARR